jgi:DNA-binding NarL/FixJ family response regulator
MGGPGARGRRAPGARTTAWVVSPHLLVAQAVAAALTEAGASVEAHTWEGVVRDAKRAQRRGEGTVHVVAIFDDFDRLVVVEDIGRLVQVGDVRVAVVVPGATATWWGGLLDGGAVDVVPRTTSISQLVEVVERLIAGDDLMDPDRRTEVRAAWAEDRGSRRRLTAMIESLSPQQHRVLELLADGHPVVEAAEMMGVAVGTVRSHVKALRAKLGARTQLEAVAMLRRVQEAQGQAAAVPRPRDGSDEAREAKRAALRV